MESLQVRRPMTLPFLYLRLILIIPLWTALIAFVNISDAHKCVRITVIKIVLLTFIVLMLSGVNVLEGNQITDSLDK